MQQPDIDMTPTILPVDGKDEEAFNLQQAQIYLGMRTPYTLNKILERERVRKFRNKLVYSNAKYVLRKDLDRIRREAVQEVDDD